MPCQARSAADLSQVGFRYPSSGAAWITQRAFWLTEISGICVFPQLQLFLDKSRRFAPASEVIAVTFIDVLFVVCPLSWSVPYYRGLSLIIVIIGGKWLFCVVPLGFSSRYADFTASWLCHRVVSQPFRPFFQVSSWHRYLPVPPPGEANTQL